MQILVSSDLTRWVWAWTEAMERQAPFALARALTRVAYRARDELREDLPRHFTIRSRWTRGGIQARRATKRNPRAYVGSRAEYMRLQAEGGERKATNGEVAVPIGARKTPESPTRPSKWPGRLLSKKGYFLVEDDDGARVYRRMRNGKLILQYVMKPSVTVKKRWPFRRTVEDVVEDRWAPEGKAALEHAMRTARLVR